MNALLTVYNTTRDFIVNRLSKISADTLGWLSVVAMHAATIPTLISLMTGITSDTPPIDLILMLWTALGLLFFKAVIVKDVLNIITISLGFMLQAIALVLIYFK